MKLFLLVFSLIAFSPYITTSQSLKAYEKAGDKAFVKKDFGAAAQYYASVLSRHDQDFDLWWKYGESSRLYSSFSEAERSYLKILGTKARHRKYPMLNYRLGEVKKSQGDYKAAIAYFEKSLNEHANPDTSFIALAKSEIENCRLADSIASQPNGVTVKHLGKNINSPWYDFAPSIVGDTLFYSSYRFDKRSKKGKSKEKISKVMLSSKGGRGRQPGRGFPSTDTAHVAHTAFSPDGHYVFFTVCQDINAYDKHCDLWMTIIDRRNRWLPPVKLPEPINLPGFTTTQPNVAFDESSHGPVLWFASDRPGGKGNMDLWQVPLDTNFFCECNLPFTRLKSIELPEFKEPTNIEELNTSGNEITPFFYPETQQLYYSSDKLPGLGGYDVFSSKKDGIVYTKPENAGAGINTSYNDLYFVLKSDGREGYLSSNRKGALYLDEKNKACCNDLFSFILPQPAKESVDSTTSEEKQEPNTEDVQPGSITEKPGKELSFDDFKGLPLFFDNDEPEKRTRKTQTSLSYDETVRDYLNQQDEYRSQFVKGIAKDKVDHAEQAIDDFFDNEVRNGADKFLQLCDFLLERLKAGENLEVTLKGYTSPRANSDYNLRLAKRRISSVRNQFERHADGALLPYLQSGKLTITEVSFGETKASLGISDDLKDLRNSIYHPDAARERRVELVEVLIH